MLRVSDRSKVQPKTQKNIIGNIYLSILIYLAAGAFAGLIAGLLGVGGGIVVVPALILVFENQGMNAAVLTHMAIATSLASIVFTSVSSIYAHHQQGAVLWLQVRQMLLGLIVGASVGVFTVLQIQGVILQYLIGIFAILIAMKMLFQSSAEKSGQEKLPSAPSLAVFGGFAGWVSSIFGIGGGSITVPFFSWCRVNMRNAVATGAACGFPIAVVGTLNNIFLGYSDPELPGPNLGYVYLPALIGVVTASVIFAKIGAKLAHRLPATHLRKVFALVLLLVGIRFLLKNF